MGTAWVGGEQSVEWSDGGGERAKSTTRKTMTRRCDDEAQCAEDEVDIERSRARSRPVAFDAERGEQGLEAGDVERLDRGASLRVEGDGQRVAHGLDALDEALVAAFVAALCLDLE